MLSEKDFTLEEVNLCRILEDSLLSFYGALKQKNITPDIRIPEQHIIRLLDPAAVSRIFSNIISNAIKYSAGDFSVVMDETGSIAFSNTAENLTLVTAGKLFDRFYTVEASRNSTGLGLSIARHLTEEMGGSIRADYQGRTLSITVSFPESPLSAGQARERTRTP